MDIIKEKIKQAYDDISEKYDELTTYKPHNAYYDRPNTLSLITDFQGKRILDAACGSGKYAEILGAKGAIVTGFDISPNMIELAKQKNIEGANFFVHDLAHPLKMLPNGYFDTVLCALAMHYIVDWTLTMQEFHRVLKPNGTLVISIEHPFFDYTYFNSTQYFETEHVKCVWKGFGTPVEINSYRRSLQSCLMPLIENGFMIDKILEPKPTPEFEKYDAKHFKELNEFPSFLCIRGKKIDKY
jgi:ubiquinone/menaquinone biosynthesis C-methylase UbiE